MTDRHDPLDTEAELRRQLAEAERERDLEIAKLIACASAVVHTVGGEVEGAPTHVGNYLQRLRALVAAERDRDALAEALDSIDRITTWAEVGRVGCECSCHRNMGEVRRILHERRAASTRKGTP